MVILIRVLMMHINPIKIKDKICMVEVEQNRTEQIYVNKIVSSTLFPIFSAVFCFVSTFFFPVKFMLKQDKSVLQMEFIQNKLNYSMKKAF